MRALFIVVVIVALAFRLFNRLTAKKARAWADVSVAIAAANGACGREKNRLKRRLFGNDKSTVAFAKCLAIVVVTLLAICH